MPNEIKHGQEFVNSFLSHYSSKYYDPVKAREYYLRNRELKGRRSTSKLTDEGKMVWDYTKSQITAEKKLALEENANKKKEEVKGLQTTAKEKRKELSEKIKLAMKGLSEETKKKIEALPKIPKGLSEKARAKAALERKEKIAKIRGEAKDVRLDTRAGAVEARKKIGEDLKATVDTARTKYKELRDGLVSEYEDKYQSEYDAIKATMSKA
ncbi:MAG: hypothetical protein E6R03_05880 [Hyphomicrobiaceae bacterium]|nr:MAG: hypothetical protein E6R03_05880 [Hyphomicrobiaceae bacterium]